MNIVNLQAENIKIIRAINITPSGHTVVIGGKNGQGKSSVLDMIMYALAGAQSLLEKPLREGTEKGYVTVNIGNYVITRKFHRKEDGETDSTLEIKNADGFKAGSPQQLLDSLCGKMTFDPLEFSRLKPKEQLEQLKELVGLDFSEINSEKERAYNMRTTVNKNLKSKEAQIQGMGAIDVNCPDSEISVSNLMQDLEIAQDKNEENKNIRSFYAKEIQDFSLTESEILNTEYQIMKLSERLHLLKKESDQKKDNLETLKKSVNSLVDVDTVPISEKIKNSESINSEVRKKKEREHLYKEARLLNQESAQITQNINSLERNKNEKMRSAQFPIPGMSFDENGVIMNGIPFSQCSTAEKLKVSVAMGISLNPKLKIMQIREGSLLDENSLSVINTMAEQSGTQIWIERVSEGSECSIIISDGHVKE